MVHYEFAQHLAAAVQSNEILEKRFGYLGFVLNSFEQIEFEDDRYIIFPEIVRLLVIYEIHLECKDLGHNELEITCEKDRKY